jgi:hypothetical protein
MLTVGIQYGYTCQCRISALLGRSKRRDGCQPPIPFFPSLLPVDPHTVRDAVHAIRILMQIRLLRKEERHLSTRFDFPFHASLKCSARSALSRGGQLQRFSTCIPGCTTSAKTRIKSFTPCSPFHPIAQAVFGFEFKDARPSFRCPREQPGWVKRNTARCSCSRTVHTAEKWVILISLLFSSPFARRTGGGC